MIAASVTTGGVGLALGYAAVQLPMFVGLIRGQARARDYFLAPLAGGVLTVAAAGGTALINACESMLGLAVAAGIQTAVGACVCGGLGYVGGRMLALREGTDRVHLRGTVINAEAQHDAPRNLRAKRSTALSLAGVPVEYADEGKHFKMIGTTGTGKSTAIAGLLDGALNRGDRAVMRSAQPTL